MLGMVIGIVILSIGISIFKQSGMGNDPGNAMLFRISEITKFPLSNIMILSNLLYFVLEFVWGKKYIGIGTFVNWVGCSYIIAFCCDFFNRIFGTPDTLLEQVLWVLAGILVMSLGVSLYQTAELGIAPYDSLAFLIYDRTNLPYSLCRIGIDSICAVICWQIGGFLGVGTVICVFGIGPFISFFNKYVSQPLICKHVDKELKKQAMSCE